jgi:hypothetical protein
MGDHRRDFEARFQPDPHQILGFLDAGDVGDRPPEADELSNAGEVTASVQDRVTTLTGVFVLAGENMT